MEDPLLIEDSSSNKGEFQKVKSVADNAGCKGAIPIHYLTLHFTWFLFLLYM